MAHILVFDFFSVFFCPFDSRNELEAYTIWPGIWVYNWFTVYCRAGGGAGVPSQLIPITGCPGELRASLPLQIATDFPAAVCPVCPGVPALPLVSNTSLAAPSPGDTEPAVQSGVSNFDIHLHQLLELYCSENQKSYDKSIFTVFWAP